MIEPPIRIGFVLHVMQVAGAEMLVADTIRRLGPRLEPVILCLDGIGQLGATMQREGIPVVDLERRPGFDVGVARRLAAEIEARRLEVIHAHQYTPFFYTALARAHVRRPMHVIFTEHGRHYPDRVSLRRRWVNRLLLARQADEITAVCRFSAESLAREDGFAQTAIEVIPNGIDTSRYGTADRMEHRRQLGLDPHRRYITCVARFHPVKDHTTLIHAFARLAGEREDVDLLLAGDGPLRAELASRVRALRLDNRVMFLGVREDIPELLRASDVFALTSVSEAASLTLLEAMASQLPVVVTSVGGNPEIVRNGEHGFLVPRGDALTIADAIKALLEAPDRASRMGRAGRQRVAECFVLQQTIDAYLERYSTAAVRLRAGYLAVA